MPDYIKIKAENTHALTDFVVPTHYKDDLSHVLIPSGLIQDRVARLAEIIAADTDTSLVACCVLKVCYYFFSDSKGAHVFFAQLVDHLKRLKNKKGLNIPMSFEFIKCKSYEGMHSTEVKISMTDEEMEEFRGKDLLICEDIVDTGSNYCGSNYERKDYGRIVKEIGSVWTSICQGCFLAVKEHREKQQLPVSHIVSANFVGLVCLTPMFLYLDYVGFSIPDLFVVGYAVILLHNVY